MHEKADDDALRRGGYIACKDRILARLDAGTLERCRGKIYPLLKLWLCIKDEAVCQNMFAAAMQPALFWSHEPCLCLLYFLYSIHLRSIPWYMFIFGFKGWYHGIVARLVC